MCWEANMKKLLASILLIFALFATSCSSSFDRQEAIDDLVEEGMTTADATCIVDEMVAEFGESKLNSNDEPTAEEEAQLFDIMSDCLFGG